MGEVVNLEEYKKKKKKIEYACEDFTLTVSESSIEDFFTKKTSEKSNTEITLGERLEKIKSGFRRINELMHELSTLDPQKDKPID